MAGHPRANRATFALNCPALDISPAWLSDEHRRRDQFPARDGNVVDGHIVVQRGAGVGADGGGERNITGFMTGSQGKSQGDDLSSISL